MYLILLAILQLLIPNYDKYFNIAYLGFLWPYRKIFNIQIICQLLTVMLYIITRIQSNKLQAQNSVHELFTFLFSLGYGLSQGFTGVLLSKYNYSGPILGLLFGLFTLLQNYTQGILSLIVRFCVGIFASGSVLSFIQTLQSTVSPNEFGEIFVVLLFIIYNTASTLGNFFNNAIIGNYLLGFGLIIFYGISLIFQSQKIKINEEKIQIDIKEKNISINFIEILDWKLLLMCIHSWTITSFAFYIKSDIFVDINIFNRTSNIVSGLIALILPYLFKYLSHLQVVSLLTIINLIGFIFLNYNFSLLAIICSSLGYAAHQIWPIYYNILYQNPKKSSVANGLLNFSAMCLGASFTEYLNTFNLPRILYLIPITISLITSILCFF